MGRKSILLLLGIVLLGLTLRICRITEMPMYGDELTMVYDTYSVLKTGMDSTGEKLPLTFRMGAGRPGGYIYASLPFVFLFGPSELGVRSASLLSGLGIIVLMYFLGKKLFDSEKVGLIASFLTSISMWDIYLSRAGFEAHFALFLALLGVTAFIHKKYIPMAISWGLATLTYPTFKLTIPLVFLALIWRGGIRKLLKDKLFFVSLVILAIFGGIILNESLKGRSEERFLRINVFSDPVLEGKIIEKVNEARTISTLPVVLKPLFYNRPLEYSRVLFESYMENISTKFLYLRGDGNPRHNPGEWGMLYLIDLPLLFAGIALLWREKKPDLALLISWILIVPLASMFILQSHGLRNAFMIPSFILISSYALSKFSKKLLLFSIILILTQLLFVLSTLYFFAPNKFASFWSAEAKKASLEALENKDKGVIVTLSTKIDNIEYAYPVYAKIDPKLVIEQYGKFPKKYDNVVITDQ